ncbi:MAG TPA: OmpA family protein [Candidatus Barnesiella excrementipullorum]|uniref:OmpA family protein n=1 Tax=Candidatus Barnesiella excrementipullorum TaxID=2838479 RepID=A0A9D1VS56_9BACT|nr:OmpA family protein [Candidatus Barnesiella excrementipullorum]
MRMKLIPYRVAAVAVVALLASQPAAKAQVMVEEEVVEWLPGKPHYYAESALDNWYISAGAGTQTFFTEHEGDPKFTLAMNFAVGKWFTPNLGFRMSAMAGQLQYNQPGHVASMKYTAAYMDVLWNMTAACCGYNENRVFSFIPFIGLGAAYGWDHSNGLKHSYALPVTGGFKINFRLAHYVDLFMEARATGFTDQFNGIVRGRQIEMVASAVAGITFKFRHDRFKAYDAYADRLAIAELNRRTNQLRAELEACRSRKIECPPCPEATVEEVVVVQPAPCQGTITASVAFDINSSTVSQREMVNVYNVAQWLKENPECNVTITGYADKGTGTAAYNMKLSKKRAESVAKLLTEKYGISSSRIQVVGEGSNIQPFPQDNNWNRIVIFTGGE